MQRGSAVLRSRSVLLYLTFSFAMTAAPLAAQQANPRPQSAPPAAHSPEQQLQSELAKHPEYWQEVARLVERLKAVKLPDPRSDSRLLPLSGRSTVFYTAFPNYGDAAMQALTIFRQELQTSAVLRQWWSSSDMVKTGPQIEDAIEQFYRISQYLGDEIVVTGSMEADTPDGLLVAEIKKPGLKEVFQQAVSELVARAKTKPDIRVLDANELAGVPATKDDKTLLVLVRPDYLAISPDADTLRRFNVRVTSGSSSFASTPFAQRIARAYLDRVTVVGALDLQHMLAKAQEANPTAANKQALTVVDQTGFSDAQYLVWEHTNKSGHDLSETELSFTAPRRGIAAWLAGPSPLGSLDFVSPKAVMTTSIVLENPALMFDDIRRLATSANPNALAFITQMEQGLKINLQEDVLRPLAGEITFELDAVVPTPGWKAVLRVNDPAHLERTLNTLLASAQVKAEQFPQAGTTFHKVPVGSGNSAMEITYAFVDGYLLVGSSPSTAMEAVRLHRSGESLARSPRFRAALPPGYAHGASMLVFQDPTAMAALQAQKFAPDVANALAALAGKNTPAVMAAYADANTIRGESTSPMMDASVMMIAAAVAIPNLLRSRVAANEATAVGSLRTINTAQVTYAATYPDRGYAPNLATLGGGRGQVSADQAGLVDASLACGATWCEKSGYRFQLRATCLQGQCPQYVAVATPVSSQTGSRNFCTLSDGVIRFQAGPPLAVAISPTECRRWTPLR